MIGQYTAFEGVRRIASGDLPEVALAAKSAIDRSDSLTLLIFDDSTGTLIDVDYRGSPDEVARRLTPPPATRGPGRPKLGVVAREVTLLPRHWDWLASQPGGASVALRKLVEEALKSSGERDRARQARDAAYRIMSAMAGDEPGFEEAARALFASDSVRFTTEIAGWPADLRDYVSELAAAAFEPQ